MGNIFIYEINVGLCWRSFYDNLNYSLIYYPKRGVFGAYISLSLLMTIFLLFLIYLSLNY